jgi:hypothetical protein
MSSMNSAHARLCSALLLSVVGAGCAVNVRSASEPDRKAAAAPSDAPLTTASHPQLCAEIRAENANADDGDYPLYVNHDPAKPWTAHCVEMSRSPREYLRLVNVDGHFNFSQYTAGRHSPGSNVKTSYHELRVDPAALLVDISDQRSAQSSGALRHDGKEVTSMPYGVAMTCIGPASGLGNIDLRGTPFAVAPDAFVQGGWAQSGTSSYSSNDQVVDLTGGGECGWTVSKPNVFNPFNQAGGIQLPLVYVAPVATAASSSPVAAPVAAPPSPAAVAAPPSPAAVAAPPPPAAVAAPPLPAPLAALQRGCDAGDLRACVTLGESLYNGKGVNTDAARAVPFFRKACDAGEATGCVDLGWAHASGTGVTKSGAAAAAQFGKACTASTAIGCLGLGVLFRDGTGVPKDPARATALFKQACDGGVPAACAMLKSMSP